MSLIPYDITPNWDIDPTELYIYTGNNRDCGKSIFQVVHYSYTDDEDKLIFREYGQVDADHFQMKLVGSAYAEKGYYAVPLLSFDYEELKYILTNKSFELYETEISSKFSKKKEKPVKETCTNKPKPKSKSKGKIMNLLNDVVERNTDAAKNAAQIAAGKAVNTTVMNKLTPHLPMLVRGYSDHPLAKVIVANIVCYGVENFAQNNKKAEWAADAMLEAAMVEFFESFNLEEILTGIFDDIKMPGEEVPVAPTAAATAAPKKRVYKKRATVKK